MPTRKSPAGKRTIGELSKELPTTLRLSIIVTVSLFWVDVIRGFLVDVFSALHVASTLLVDFIIALIVTALALLVLFGYRKIRAYMNRLAERRL